MFSSQNTYTLDQGNKEFILTISIIGSKLKITCQNIFNENNMKFTRDFTIEEINKQPKPLNLLIIDGIKYKLLGAKKNKVDIPLLESYYANNEIDLSQIYQDENIANYGGNNYSGTESFFNSGFTQNNPVINSYNQDRNQHEFGSNINSFENQYMNYPLNVYDKIYENKNIYQNMGQIQENVNNIYMKSVINEQKNNFSEINKNDVIKNTKNNENTNKQKMEKENEEKNKILKSQLAELESLRKKVSEMEVEMKALKKQLNTYKGQVAEYNAVKSQFKDLDKLRIQVGKLTEENQKLKERVEELENIKQNYEEEINNLKRNDKNDIIKPSESNNMELKDEMEQDNQDNSQESTVKGDIIHDSSELELLTQKINKLNQKLTLNLLYKATHDSDKAEAFHAKCDDAKSTIVLVETKKGKRFGGYTTCSWSGDCIEKKDEEAFVFSLDKMLTYDNIPGEDAIGCYPKFGPIFLGCQIRIYDNAFTKGGSTFEAGLNYETEEDYELTGGDRLFDVKEIEVYEVLKE